MKLVLNDQEWKDVQYAGAYDQSVHARWYALDEWWEHTVALITDHVLRYPEELKEDYTFTMLVAPFTVLEPMQWTTDQVEQMDPQDEMTDVLWNLALYAHALHVDAAFTVVGWWSGDAGTDGLFGYKKGAEDELMILFC